MHRDEDTIVTRCAFLREIAIEAITTRSRRQERPPLLLLSAAWRGTAAVASHSVERRWVVGAVGRYARGAVVVAPNPAPGGQKYG